MPSIVAVTESEFRKAEPVFTSTTRFTCVTAPSDEAGLVRAIADSGADHAVVGHRRYESALYSALKRGRVLARFGVGHEGIDKAKATAAGILCTNTPGTLDASVAELGMLLIASAARHLPELHSKMAGGVWAPRVGIELKGKRLAIVGSGRIGTALASIAAHGYGMRVTGFVRQGTPTAPADPYERLTSDFQECVSDADFVSLHIGASPENLRFVNRERLALLASHAWLINTARGAVVDELALFDTLSNGRLAGAALDVFDREPYEPADAAHDLRLLPNVIMTPHVGSNTPDANHRMAAGALRNIALAEDGDFASMALLNPDVLR
jgi:phosphoglycerate dehydrogenase-like enzyme